MIHRLRLGSFAMCLAVSALALAGVASADDGTDRKPPCTSPQHGPSCTILRPPAPSTRIPPPGAPECIVAVGGLGSFNDDYMLDPKTNKTADTFESLLAPFRNDPRYQIHRFGSSEEDPRFRYDTSGSIDAGGLALRDFVRSLSGRCALIHIVAHSMGGAVADRAFSLGLSAADGVATYLPISAPHNGAVLAQILTGANDISDEGNEALRAISQAFRAVGAQDVTSDAVRDLAEISMPRPPRGVIEVRQRLANDEIVLLPDSSDWRFESRDRLPDLHGIESVAGDLVGAATGSLDLGALARDAAAVGKATLQHGLDVIREAEGHGGSLVNAAIRGTTAFVIRNLALPPDDRDLAEKILAFALSVGMLILMVFLAGKVAGALVNGVLIGTWVTVPLRAVLPGWTTWWTRSFPHLLETTTVTLAEKEVPSVNVSYVKGVVTRLRNEVDRLAMDGDVEFEDEHTRSRKSDPRVALVRGVLDRAAALLARL